MKSLDRENIGSENNKKLLAKYTKLWDEIKNQIETINGGKPIKYKKGFHEN